MDRIFAVLLAGLLLSCIEERGPTCRRQSECVASGGAQGRVCSNRGRCEAECSRDQDCPSHAVCATTCGVCFQSDRTPATCFTAALPPGAALGACRDFDFTSALARIQDAGVIPPSCDAPSTDRPLPYPEVGTAATDVVDSGDAAAVDAADATPDSHDGEGGLQ